MKLLYPALSIIAAMAAANELQANVNKLRANKGEKKSAPETDVYNPWGPTPEPNVDMPLGPVQEKGTLGSSYVPAYYPVWTLINHYYFHDDDVSYVTFGYYNGAKVPLDEDDTY
jgi:hypothetical protein